MIMQSSNLVARFSPSSLKMGSPGEESNGLGAKRRTLLFVKKQKMAVDGFQVLNRLRGRSVSSVSKKYFGQTKGLPLL